MCELNDSSVATAEVYTDRVMASCNDVVAVSEVSGDRVPRKFAIPVCSKRSWLGTVSLNPSSTEDSLRGRN